MTTTVLLIRHATHDRLNRMLCGRMPGVSISEPGQAQARELADRLADTGIAAIYSSPLERARETAEPLAERLGLPIQPDPLLAEIDFGEWTGLTFEALHRQPEWGRWNRERSRSRPPGGETIQEVQGRLVEWLRAMAAAHPDQTIAGFTHADTVKAAVLEILGAPIDRLHNFTVDPASVTRITVRHGEPRLVSLNETAR